MLSLVLSTVAFFLANHFIRQYLDEMGIPKGMTRGIFVFVLAAVIAYSVAYIVDLIGS
jgi:hypothetical protein